MADFETDIAEQLIQIFPNLSREIIDISIKHPSNRSTPLNVAYLVQNCIDDLLELRTFSETTGTKRSNETNNKNERESSVASTSSERNLENSYRDNPYVIHSDDSNDEDMVQFAEKVDAGLFQDISAKSSPNDCIITNPTITTSENVVLSSNIQTTVKYSAKVSNSPQVSPIKKPTFTYSSPLKKMQTNVGDPPSDVSPSAWNEWRKTKDSEIDSELPTLISPSAMKKKQRKVSEDNNKNYGRNNNSNKSTAPVQKIIKSEMPRTLINNALLNNETQVWNGQKDVNALSNFAIQQKGQNRVESVIVPGKQLKRTYENTSVSNNISETITLLTNPLVGDNKNKAEVAISSSTHGNKLSNEDGKCNILQKKQCSTAPGNKILPNFSKAEVRNSGEIPGVKVNSSRPSGISYRTPTYLNESESTDSSSEDDEFPEEKEVVKTENVKQLTSNKLDLEATLNDLYNFSHGSQTQQRGNISNNTQDITNKSKNNIPSSQGTDTYKALSQRKETNSAVTTPTQLSRTNQSSDSNVKNSVETVSKGGAPKIFRTVTHDTDTVDNQNPKRNLPSNSALDLNKSTPGSDIDRREFDMKPKKAETITTTTEDTFVIDNPRPGCSQNNSRSNRVKYETEIKQDTCVLKIKRVIETNPTQNACPVSVSTSCTILSSNNNNSLNLDKQNNPSNLPNNLSLNHRKNVDVLQQGNDGYNGRDKMTTNLLGIGTNVLDNRHDKKTMRGNDSHKEMKIKQAIDTSSTQTTNKVVNVENLNNGWLNVTAVKGQKNNVPMVDLTKNERDLPTVTAPVNQILIPEPTVLVPEPAILIPEPDPEELTPEKKVV
ncbi:hypothetical protein KUTeg_003025 [Tegillarca granosa]|uniref:CUE domain-containing protein n=1 Tax=Tegillarca granosa TaxID=220873 RepID=A0ABQ9FKX5_TEGGR|nr:hypothetical protein KUTeg_003025 [Tegillarca granosa]